MFVPAVHQYETKSGRLIHVLVRVSIDAILAETVELSNHEKLLRREEIAHGLRVAPHDPAYKPALEAMNRLVGGHLALMEGEIDKPAGTPLRELRIE